MDYVWTQLFLKQGLYTYSLGSNCALIEDSGRSPRVSLAWPFMCSVKAHAYFITILPAQTFGHPTEFIFISIRVCKYWPSLCWIAVARARNVQPIGWPFSPKTSILRAFCALDAPASHQDPLRNEFGG